MSNIIVGHYIRFRNRNGTYIPTYNFQNFFIGETRTYNNVKYRFAPFAISGGSNSLGGDRGQATLVTATEEISVAYSTEAIRGTYLIDVSSVLCTLSSSGVFSEQSPPISTEIWSCSSGSQNIESHTITLSSPLDATANQAPKRVFSQYLVGSLPPTGAIAAR